MGSSDHYQSVIEDLDGQSRWDSNMEKKDTYLGCFKALTKHCGRNLLTGISQILGSGLLTLYGGHF